MRQPERTILTERRHTRPDEGERRLWCAVIRQAVEAAQGGDKSARLWLDQSSVFANVCRAMDLNAETIRRRARGR